MKFRKQLQHVPAALAAAAVLAGCGGGGGAAAPGNAPGTLVLSPQSQSLLALDAANLPDYTPQLPPHYAGAAENTPPGAVGSPVVAALGRVLFHDRQLSVNGAVSCASCHKQTEDFGDGRRFSTGFDGGLTTAHAMRLANIRFFQPGTMFWDKRAPSLEAQASLPIQHPVEMGFDAAHGGMPALVQKLQAVPYYADLFTGAFGDPAVTEERMQQALSQFMRAMVSTNSRWDDAFAQVFDPTLPDKGVNKPLPGFTEEENRGRALFMASRAEGGQACAACHQPPSFALGNSGSNGLDAGEARRFKSASLKNVARSSAFMHDGRFSTLEDVVEHYSTGVQDGPGLDGRLKGADGQPLRPSFSPQDKAALVAFLRTLSDPVLAADPRFASPFRADAVPSVAAR
ncbi:MAG TPA: cytochrome c peroxidase [Ramlibacter sp.]|jgi:cytochrome c peroxidase|uniref:cytochrome-c peroxidase n=1 Tax=Ramlibacter sp. TaxID=1917967 RepID=UPI002D2BCBC8|nr:cytochrome c peroxidase [Ramlibacter sp.]HZY19282.1 cytochrome c peroxidase [Ramlibacter sp.]